MTKRTIRFYDRPACGPAYYPEINPLVPLNSVGITSNTPTSKSVPVLFFATKE